MRVRECFRTSRYAWRNHEPPNDPFCDLMDGLPAVVICNGQTKKGKRCARPVGENGMQCWRHAPETAELARAASVAGAETRNRTVTELLREGRR